jgi:hypothetical protein
MYTNLRIGLRSWGMMRQQEQLETWGRIGMSAVQYSSGSTKAQTKQPEQYVFPPPLPTPTHSPQTVQSITPPPTFSFNPILTSNNLTNTSLYFSLTAQRTLTLSSTITTSSGPQNQSWTQDLSFSNIQNMTSLAYNQSLAMVTNGSFSSNELTSTYEYPLNLYSAYIIAPSVATLSSVFALVDRSFITSGVNLLNYLSGIKGEEEVKTRQLGESFYAWNETIVEGVGDANKGVTEEWYSYEGSPGLEIEGVQEYGRYLKEVDGGWVDDEEGWKTMDVPATVPLPYVEGEPVV